MSVRINELNQPIGDPVENWSAAVSPPATIMSGQYCRVEPLDINRDCEHLFDAFSSDTDARNWTYLPYGPFSDLSDFRAWLVQTCQGKDPLFHVVVDDVTERAVGLASYLRIEPSAGVIEVGHIHFSPVMQRSRISTEAMYLMMKRVFGELGYRRYEWKCDSHNQASRSTALRLGFEFEGIFRQAAVYKNRNRDTAWFAIIDKEWPEKKAAFERWLNPANFDSNGSQIAKLADL